MPYLRRPHTGASVQERTQFGRDLMAALSELCVAPGEEFWVEARGDVSEPAEGQHRAADGATARAAAVKDVGRKGSQREKVFTAIAESRSGLIPDELVGVSGVDYRSLTPRIGELKNGGWVVGTGETRKSSTESDSEILVLTAKGVEEYATRTGKVSTASIGRPAGLFESTEPEQTEGSPATPSMFDPYA